MVTLKDGCLNWDEFLDLFFLKIQKSQQDRGVAMAKENWWRFVGREGADAEGDGAATGEADGKAGGDDAAKKKQSAYTTLPRYGRQTPQPGVGTIMKFDDPNKKPVKMTD